MAEAKFTPGPWDSFELGVFTMKEGHLCALVNEEPCGAAAAFANARLIAAAPELLEALQAIYEACDGYVPNTSKAAWNNARLAILKATGEQA